MNPTRGASRARHAAAAALLTIASAFAALPADAADAKPVAADVLLERRVNALAAELRCLVCQNQSLADSHAELAIDLKNQVREQLAAGRSEAEVIAYMTERYGDFVLYRPPLKPATLLLWAGPLLLALGGAALLWRALKARERMTEPPADDAWLDDGGDEYPERLGSQARPGVP